MADSVREQKLAAARKKVKTAYIMHEYLIIMVIIVVTNLIVDLRGLFPGMTPL